MLVMKVSKPSHHLIGIGYPSGSRRNSKLTEGATDWPGGCMQDWHRRYEMSSVSKIKTPTKIEKKCGHQSLLDNSF